MAKPRRKATKGKPITQHQLFPAVVALWFGALFGLGSLAIRPSLLEDLVIKSRIDLLVPAAAPPLGMTARMLIALILAATGAMIGAWIARRLTRPKQEVRERKRTNLSTRDEGADSGSFNSYGDASTRNPAPAGDAAASPGVLAGRRRSLTIEQSEDDFVLYDMAPLPGGTPQIFDIAAAGLDDAPAHLAAAAEPGNYSEASQEPASAPVALDWANATPLDAPAAPIASTLRSLADAQQPQVFAPVEPVVEAAATDNRQVFGMAPPATPPSDRPRQIFGAPVMDDHVPKEFIEAHGFRSSVFTTPEPSPLFAPREAAAPEASPAAFPPPVEAAAPAPATEPIAAAPASHTAPGSVPEPQPALPSPATLGIEDLSARLAESMRRRRAGRTAVAVPVEPAPVATADTPNPVEVVLQAQTVEPEAAAEPAPTFSVPSLTVPSLVVSAAPEPVGPFAIASQAPLPIPAALRPLDLSGFEEGDHASADNLLPPRRIVSPPEAVSASDEPATSVQAPAEPAEVETDAVEESAVAEEVYASLLGVTPSPASLRNPFVRVEEPEAEAETVEPVVIFPGQSVPPPQPMAQIAATVGTEPTPFRRFDSPNTAGQGQPSAANEAANAVPPEEAERALRSALANLQRMSGAA